VVPGTFYFHFPTKNHVLLELGNRSIARVVESLPGTPENPPALSQLLAELADATLGVERELGDNELLRAAVSSFQRPPADVELETTGLIELLQASIDAELQGGPEPGGLAAGELAVILLTAFFGALLVGPEDPEERSQQLHKTLDFFARALARQGKSG
jgi:AcrR family transcriptional regulator